MPGVDYTCALAEPEFDIRKVIFVSLLLAAATLVHLLERIKDLFTGIEVKISRETVGSQLTMAERSVAENHAVRRAWAGGQRPAAHPPRGHSRPLQSGLGPETIRDAQGCGLA